MSVYLLSLLLNKFTKIICSEPWRASYSAELTSLLKVIIDKHDWDILFITKSDSWGVFRKNVLNVDHISTWNLSILILTSNCWSDVIFIVWFPRCYIDSNIRLKAKLKVSYDIYVIAFWHFQRAVISQYLCTGIRT